MPKNIHDDTMFRWNKPGHGIKIVNAGTHDIGKDHIVCFYASDAITVYGISQFATTTDGQGGYTVATNWGRKVLGVASETIAANGGSGIIYRDGFLACSVSTNTSIYDYLRLDTASAGLAMPQAVTGYSPWEYGYVFGIAVSGGSTTVNMFMFPWRY